MQNKINIDEILDRTKLILNAKSDIDLSKKLGKSDTYIGQCRKRKSIDFDLIFEIVYDFNFDWLVTGMENRSSNVALTDDNGNKIIRKNGTTSNEDIQILLNEKNSQLQIAMEKMFKLQEMLAEYQLREKSD